MGEGLIPHARPDDDTLGADKTPTELAAGEVTKMNYYERLGLQPSATSEEIQAAFRVLAKKHHPDTGNGNKEIMSLLGQAYEALEEPDKRTAYDRAAGFAVQRPRSAEPPRREPTQEWKYPDFYSKSAATQVFREKGPRGVAWWVRDKSRGLEYFEKLKELRSDKEFSEMLVEYMAKNPQNYAEAIGAWKMVDGDLEYGSNIRSRVIERLLDQVVENFVGDANKDMSLLRTKADEWKSTFDLPNAARSGLSYRMDKAVAKIVKEGDAYNKLREYKRRWRESFGINVRIP